MPYYYNKNKFFFLGNDPITKKVLKKIENCSELYFFSSSENHFNQPIDGILPEGILKIVIRSPGFNQSLDSLPSTLKILKLVNGLESMEFNKSIENLPDGLENLQISGKFNQPVDFLPRNLKKLNLGEHFDQPLDNLPPELEELELSSKYSHSLLNLPKTIWSLHLEHPQFKKNDIEEKFVVKLPEGVTHLSLGDLFDDYIDFNIPESLQYISFGEFFNHSLVRDEHKLLRLMTIVVSSDYYGCVSEKLDITKREKYKFYR